MPWTYPAYCWPDEAAGRAAIAAQGWQDGRPIGVDLLMIGTRSVPAHPPVEGEPEPEMVTVPGWWLACAFRDVPPPAEWASARVQLLDGMPRLGTDPVPASVTRFQARAALAEAGLLDQVEAAVAAGPLIARLAWQDAAVFERASPTLTAIAADLGVTEAEMDGLFRRAAEIVA